MTPAWCRNIRRYSNAPISILSLDGKEVAITSKDVSVENHSYLSNLGYGSGDLIRLEFICEKLRLGISCAQLDLDVHIKSSIDPIADLGYDFLISRAFNFPNDVAEAQGFVLCTGFYIAKPGALVLCQDLRRYIRNQTYESNLDQFVINKMLEGIEWRHIQHREGEWQTTFSICDYKGVRVCVLGTRDIARDTRIRRSVFGNHDPLIGRYYASPFLAENKGEIQWNLWKLRMMELDKRVVRGLRRVCRTIKRPE